MSEFRELSPEEIDAISRTGGDRHQEMDEADYAALAIGDYLERKRKVLLDSRDCAVVAKVIRVFMGGANDP